MPGQLNKEGFLAVRRQILRAKRVKLLRPLGVAAAGSHALRRARLHHRQQAALDTLHEEHLAQLAEMAPGTTWWWLLGRRSGSSRKQQQEQVGEYSTPGKAGYASAGMLKYQIAVNCGSAM